MDRNAGRFDKAIQLIDWENSQDPNHEIFMGQEYPKELLYAIRMTSWLEKLAPEASEELRLAARSQHICRWVIPRANYEMNRKGYLLWRTALKKFHAEKAGRILRECGYGSDEVKRVQSLILKEKIKLDPESQLLEDVVCLVFLENYLLDFAHRHDRDKMTGIICKTWKKMSNRGRREAQNLNIPDEAIELISKALEDSDKTG